MKTTKIVGGLILTITVFAIAVILGPKINLNSDFIAGSFMTHTIMLALSVGLIIALRKQVNFRIAVPQFKQTLKPLLFGFLTAVVVNITLGIITVIISGSAEKHPGVANASLLQFLVFDIILAPVAEESLFRGFLQNYLRPLGDKGFTLLRRRISLPVLISALAFSLAHLILVVSGVGVLFMVRILVFTFVLGLFAGYYQEKYNNHIFAILVHMAGNMMGLISAII